MIALLCFFLTLIASPSKLKSRLAAEHAVLRQSAGTARSRPLLMLWTAPPPGT
jgi:hypothetical protein